MMTRREEIMEAIRTYWAEHSFSPSIRDLVEMTDISSTYVVNYYLERLERDGFITREPRTARSIVVVEDA